MSKKETKKPQEQVYIDPELQDEGEDQTPPPQKQIVFNPNFQIPLTGKGLPIQQSPGKGRKMCQTPGCGLFVAPTTKICPKCNQEFVKGAKSPVAKQDRKQRQPRESQPIQESVPQTISTIQLLKVLRGRGFEFSATIDALDENAAPQISGNPQIEALFKEISFDDSQSGIKCISTNPKIEFAIDLDTLLSLMKLPPRK